MKKSVRVVPSWQAMEMLEELVGLGLYGRDVAEVALRFIDKELIRLVENGIVKIPKRKEPKKRVGKWLK